MEVWSIGRITFKLSEEELWGLTFPQFQALTRRYEDEQNLDNFRFGLIGHIIESLVSKKPRQPLDYFKSRNVASEGDAKAAQIIANVKAYNNIAKLVKKESDGRE